MKNQPKSPSATARSVAFEVLQKVLRQKQPFDESFDHALGIDTLEPRDKGFAHLLVATVLRRLGQIDDIIVTSLEKPTELKAKPMDLLRIGAAQILFLGTPPHAAVDSMVTLAAVDNATAPFKGLINAVLRRIVREGPEKLKHQDTTKLNIPAWLWLSWRQSYNVATARALAEACLGEAQTDLSVKSDAAGWAVKLNARLLPGDSLRLTESTPIPQIEGFKEGSWWVQDAAAALPVLLMGDIKDKKIIDLCAAPGGKTAQMASRGAKVTALDRAPKRVERLKENIKRLGLDVEVHCAEGAKFLPAVRPDIVLLDAPCSATGTIRRHPDILRLKHKEDVARLVEAQKELLEHAYHHLLGKGGMLIYAVCSLQREEAEDQIKSFLERHSNVKRVPIKPEEMEGCAEFITSDGDLRTLPSMWEAWGGLDGFYAARLVLA